MVSSASAVIIALFSPTCVEYVNTATTVLAYSLMVYVEYESEPLVIDMS